MNEISRFSPGMPFFFSHRQDDAQFPRSMGNKNAHACKLQQHLYDQMLAQSELCDITLVAGDIEIKAHWSVMVSCPYFQSLYESNMTEKKAGRIVIGVGKTSAIRAAINFLYLGTLEITYSGIRDILQVADYLQITDMKKACTDYLSSFEVTVENCVDLCLLGSLYDLDVYNCAFEFLRGNLPEVMKQPDMLSLTPDSIMELLKDRALNYVSAEEFYNFIVKWVEHDKANRKEYFEDMFCELELKTLSKEFLEKSVETSEMVIASKRCKLSVLNIKMKQMAGLLSQGDDKDVILLVGGSGSGQFFGSLFMSPLFQIPEVMSIANLYAYVVQEDRWTELAPLPYPIRQPLVAYDKGDNRLLVIDNINYTSSCIQSETLLVFEYKMLEKTWKSLSIKLLDYQSDINIYNILVANNKIFILAAIRALNGPSEREFEVVMIRIRDDLTTEICCRLFFGNNKTNISSCVVDDRFVCVYGCKCARGPQHLKSKLNRFVYFDSKHDVKHEGPKRVLGHDSMIIPVKDELLFTRFGKHKGDKFNFAKRQWIPVKGLSVPNPVVEPNRTDYVCTTFENQMFVFGGKSAKPKELINSACKFDFQTRMWTKLEDVPKAIAQCGIATVKLPAELIKCHIDCPHCKFDSIRSATSYQIEYPDDADIIDDDDDFSYDDDDVDNYSDYWADDFYVEYSDHEWF